ncbi:Beta-barrel assembly machine subunit BamE [Gemmobacter aquatilis]|uniref:Beta-barrel assembly machine subunit BamE n=1 Tax=Gemmobacter aquatilis TaxID=933059 RepID=A0A1H8BC30_9RHOB|nr:outer membrane protein assembly factor BamE [Gemmobacter aquatilis]SEM80435.1 Beta-barrel assembly machine subunit BamE [Gemmobacter aquatilis]
MSHSGKHRHAGKTGVGASIQRRVPRWLAAGVLVLGIAACTPIYRDHGYVPTEEELAAVEVGKDTRETVAEKVGRPSTSGLLNDVGWFYVQSRWEEYAARAPKEIDRQGVAITFTEAGLVQNVERFGLEDGQVVTLSRRVTDTNIKGVSFIRQIMGNLGRMRAVDMVN